MIDHIKLSSYDGNPDWRIGRLNQYIGVLQGKEPYMLRQIEALHDHKGILFILWVSEPQIYDRLVADRTWESFNEPQPEHFTLRDKEKYPGNGVKYISYAIDLFGSRPNETVQRRD